MCSIISQCLSFVRSLTNTCRQIGGGSLGKPTELKLRMGYLHCTKLWSHHFHRLEELALHKFVTPVTGSRWQYEMVCSWELRDYGGNPAKKIMHNLKIFNSVCLFCKIVHNCPKAEINNKQNMFQLSRNRNIHLSLH